MTGGNVIRGSSTCGSTCCGSHSQTEYVDSNDTSNHSGEVNTMNGSTFIIQSSENHMPNVSNSLETDSSNAVSNEVVTFEDTDTQQIRYAAIYDEVASDLYTPNYELGDFLGRPTKLYHYSITPGAPFASVESNVWTDFFQNTGIQRKLHNFAYIQCKLKLKVVVNSTPFIYGYFGMSYKPLYSFNPISDASQKILTSQRHTVWMDLSKSEGGEMELPFFYYLNWVPINLATTTDGLGSIKIWEVVQASIANAGITSTPSITIYAWAEDVRLYGNTVNLAIQSSESSGPISSIASTVAKGSAYFTEIPIIGRFAKAINIGSTAVGAIASMFGFTNHPVIDDATPFKNMPFHGLASAHISNVVDKLTLDPANELTISPTTVGLPACDELAIANIVSKDAIIALPTWATTDASMQLLFSANVCTTHCQLNTATANQTIVYETPTTMVSRLFSSWRGDVLYKFKVIKSPYHKGRIVINYDPAGDIFTTSDNNNLVQTVIVDISEVDEFTVRVPYMAPQSFLMTNTTAQPDYGSRANPTGTYDADYHNGRLTVRVLNQLTAPLDTASVTLVVRTCGAENLEFTNPTDIYFDNSSGGPANHWVIQSSETPTTYVMGKARETISQVYDVNMGERIASLREVMRRSNYIGTERLFDNTAGSSFNSYSFMHTKYPQAPGYDPNGIHGAVQINGAGVDSNYNYVSCSAFYYITSCFVGMRGSTIWHYNVQGLDPATKMQVSRQYDDKFNGTAVTTRAALRTIQTNTAVTSFSNTARAIVTRSRAGGGGLSLMNQRTQTGLSVLYPQYNKFRFVTANPENNTYGSSIDDSINEKFVLKIDMPNKNGCFSTFDRYFSIGPDFNVFYFLNVPPRYVYVRPTAATF